MNDKELIEDARDLTACRCVDAPEQECGKHGDATAKLIGALADALEAAGRAAQGAAPQAGRCQTCSREASFCAHCVAEMELPPVLPSSGVDETALAEVIRRADAEWQVREARLETASKLTHAQYVARAVAEWLRARAEAYRQEMGEQ